MSFRYLKSTQGITIDQTSGRHKTDGEEKITPVIAERRCQAGWLRGYGFIVTFQGVGSDSIPCDDRHTFLPSLGGRDLPGSRAYHIAVPLGQLMKVCT